MWLIHPLENVIPLVFHTFLPSSARMVGIIRIRRVLKIVIIFFKLHEEALNSWRVLSNRLLEG